MRLDGSQEFPARTILDAAEIQTQNSGKSFRLYGRTIRHGENRSGVDGKQIA